MDQLFEFITNHWMLVAAFVVIIVLLIFEELKGSVRGLPKVSPQEVTRMINRDEALVLDVRDENAYHAGHIIGAEHVVPSQIDSKINKLQKHKEKPVIVVCQNGSQASVNIGVKLRKLGFNQLYLLTGGMQAWKQASLPLTKNKS